MLMRLLIVVSLLSDGCQAVVTTVVAVAEKAVGTAARALDGVGIEVLLPAFPVLVVVQMGAEAGRKRAVEGVGIEHGVKLMQFIGGRQQRVSCDVGVALLERLPDVAAVVLAVVLGFD